MLWRILFLLLLNLLFVSAPAQKRVLSATRVAAAPRIDGHLEEACWQEGDTASGFIQSYPDNGKPSRHRNVIRIFYDDNALYIGARLYDDPALIRRQLTARDGESRQDVDYFAIFLDTYHDQQNGFEFLVTTANVQSDARLSGGGSSSLGSDYGDKSWDAVWQSATATDAQGWVAEMRIPYISLRFTKKDVQTWGLQLLRFSRRDNENSYWNAVDPNMGGFVNQFGGLEGLRDIRPPLRLSFSPYLSGGVRYDPDNSRNHTEVLRSGGMDVKWGISKSFTLDATLIPDFGQVVSDNLVNNLSPYEIRFQENRPFFTEGTELFNKAGIFYSRRIGAVPTGYYGVESAYSSNADYEIISNPSVTRLYNAVKFSGRTSGKLGIGVFNAVTAPMKAKVRNLATKQDSLIETEPMANYNLLVFDQALRGRSSLTLSSGTVLREGSRRDANTTALDWALYSHGNNYAFTGTLRGSNVFGYTPWSSSLFYYTDTVTRNGSRYLKPYSGFATRARYAKVSGRWRWYGQVNVESDKYDPNDLGYLQAPNEVTYSGNLAYNINEPTKHFIIQNYSITAYQTSLYKPYGYSISEVTASAYWVFRNFWDVGVTVGSVPQKQNDFFELRNFNYRLRRPAFSYANIEGSTDSRKKLYYSFRLGYATAVIANSPYYEVYQGLRYRFSNRLLLSLDLTRSHDKLQIGSAYQADPGIVGYRDSRDFTSVLSGSYAFTARMNLTLRARHYWNQVHYLSFWKVDEHGDPQPHAFINDQDLNYNVFNLDAFYTWDFRPGSRIVLGWKNGAGGNYAIDGNHFHNYSGNLLETFTQRHANEFTVRIIYFLDYNQLRKKSL